MFSNLAVYSHQGFALWLMSSIMSGARDYVISISSSNLVSLSIPTQGEEESKASRGSAVSVSPAEASYSRALTASLGKNARRLGRGEK